MAFTLADLKEAQATGKKVPMLTCYDYTTARQMSRCGISTLLVGDSAANVILGLDTTLGVSLDFLIALTGGVVRGAPECWVVGDMPFGSYQASEDVGLENIFRMMSQSGCQAVKLEVGSTHTRLIYRAADAGVPVVAHLGLRPQTVHMAGGYKAAGTTQGDAARVVNLAMACRDAGAVAILLEAVPPGVSEEVVKKTGLPVIGCGAGPAPCCHVVVSQDLLRQTERQPRFVPDYSNVTGGGNASGSLDAIYLAYKQAVEGGTYPAKEHLYGSKAD